MDWANAFARNPLNAAAQFAENIVQQQQQAQESAENRTPPASERIRRQLPVIRVGPADIKCNGNNPDCVICFDPLNNNDSTSSCTRLPCAHVFHTSCIQDWLSRNCACPTCRYELPTDDPTFEQGRLERMRLRRPLRYPQSVVERMALQELRRLLPSSGSGSSIPNGRVVDRASLVEYLVEMGQLEVLPAPPAVEYRLAELRNMSVKQLRRVMQEDAEVFFDPKDVVEKEDMIQIFLASGRLSVIPEAQVAAAEQDEAMVAVETVDSEDEEENGSMTVDSPRVNINLVMEENTGFGEIASGNEMEVSTADRGDVTTVGGGDRATSNAAAFPYQGDNANTATVHWIAGSIEGFSLELVQELLRHLECRSVSPAIEHIVQRVAELDSDQVVALKQYIREGIANRDYQVFVSNDSDPIIDNLDSFLSALSDLDLIILLNSCNAVNRTSPRSAVLEDMQVAARARPETFLYLRSVAPLASLSRDQLRAVAQSRLGEAYDDENNNASKIQLLDRIGRANTTTLRLA